MDSLPVDAAAERCLAPFDPAVGGRDYDPGLARADADTVVATEDEFVSALGNASDGEFVWLASEAVFDLRDRDTITVDAPDVTVASDGTPTVLVEKPTCPLLELTGAGIRVSGFAIRGGEQEFFRPSDRAPDDVDGAPIYWVGLSAGVRVNAPGVEIDGMDVSGMTYAGVHVDREAFRWGADARRTHVHHCSIHDNPADSLGYGVTVGRGNPHVDYCWFDNNRHAVAASGGPNCGYEVRECVFGPATASHVLDVHGQAVDDAEYDRAGRRIVVEENVVQATRDYANGNVAAALYVRGRPAEESSVARNVFYLESEDAAIVQAAGGGDGYTNLRVENNRYGVEGVAASLDDEMPVAVGDLVDVLPRSVDE